MRKKGDLMSKDLLTGAWLNCEMCGIEIYRTPSHLRSEHNFCSKACTSKFISPLNIKSNLWNRNDMVKRNYARNSYTCLQAKGIKLSLLNPSFKDDLIRTYMIYLFTKGKIYGKRNNTKRY